MAGNEQGAAAAVDEVLRRLMPSTSGVLSYAAVARHCGCSPGTPRSWLLSNSEISVPDEPGRSRLIALVADTLGLDEAALLQDKWSSLAADAPSDFSQGDGAVASTGTGAADELSLADRRLVVAQAMIVLEEAYAHLPFKRALHAVDPVQRLKLFDYRLSQQRPGDQSEAAFHREMIDIFTTLRDLHTSYVVPWAYRKAVVILPFRVEEYFEPVDGGVAPVYVASKVNVENDQVVVTTFDEGVRITHWNGVRIHRAIQLLADRQAAGNAPAAFGRALDALTVRPLLSAMEPDEEWVDVTYVDTHGESLDARFRWIPRKAPQELLPDHLQTPLGIDAQTHAVSAVRKELYAERDKDAKQWDLAEEANGGLADPVAVKSFHVPTTIPSRFRAHPTRDGRFGYLRIFSFATPPRPTTFIAEFARLIGELPQDGLIIDVRGNGGGSIVAAESCLQALTDRRIRTARSQFTTSPLLLDICQRHAEPSRKSPGFGLWVDSLRSAVVTGSAYSRGFPITPDEALDTVTSHYPGNVVLIVDSLCYSATDMFAAGFVDNEIGRILGTSDNTGAGGANVWEHSDLVKLADPDSDLEKLPNGINFKVAVRRTTRVGLHEGDILEDLGIEIEDRHYMSKADVFEGNVDLIAAASNLLDAQG